MLTNHSETKNHVTTAMVARFRGQCCCRKAAAFVYRHSICSSIPFSQGWCSSRHHHHHHRHRCDRPFSTSSSLKSSSNQQRRSSVWEDPAFVWARDHPQQAQSCLNPPPLSSYDDMYREPFSHNHVTDDPSLPRIQTLEEYLQWRQWWWWWRWWNTSTKTHPSASVEEAVVMAETDDKEEDVHHHQLALISHVLSTPLTLASQLGPFILQQNQHSRRNDEDTNDYMCTTAIASMMMQFKVCCVGARAEASLPPVYWKECLRLLLQQQHLHQQLELSSHKVSQSQSLPYHHQQQPLLDLTLDFVGPDIPPVAPNHAQSVVHGSMTLTLRNLYQGFYHTMMEKDHVDDDGNQRNWDAHAFFNPGFGHLNLTKGWEETLNVILHQNTSNTRKRTTAPPAVLLLTAHSEKDADRDAAFLAKHFGLHDIRYILNPFASRIQYQDPFDTHQEEPHLVKPNHYVAVVHLHQ